MSLKVCSSSLNSFPNILIPGSAPNGARIRQTEALLAACGA
jgi:hypothetical protein